MNLDAALSLLASDPAAPLDLAELSLHLARAEYPDLDIEAYLGELNGMAHEASRYLRGSLEAQVTGLCRYLFHEMGFRGNTQEYYDPRNSYFNQVLERRTGIPITLSAVAIAVGNRAGLDLAGVGLPGHFVVKAILPDQEVLFDPFHGGRQITPEQCERLVFQVTGMSFEATPTALQALPTGLVIQRMLNNLKGIYLRLGDFPRSVRVIQRLRQLCPTDLLQQRDLGVSLLHSGQPGPAIDHLAAYVNAAGKASDAKNIRELLDQARSEVSKWN